MKTLTLKTPEEIEIYLNPFRMKIMRLMKSMDRPMTVTEIADEMGLAPAKVHYHVKKLVSIGVLALKYTKVINGIVAKYYDFATDSIALSVMDSEGSTDVLRSKVMTEYGGYFDEAKQKFFNLYNAGDSLDEGNIYITVKDSFPVDPGRIGEMNDELQAVLKKYRSKSEDAVRYGIFMFLIQNDKDDKKT